MRSGRAWIALAVSLAALSGCGPKKPVAGVSPAVRAPELPPTEMALALPQVPPALPVVARRSVKLDTTAPPLAKPEVAVTEPRKTPKHRPAHPSADEAKAQSAASQPAAQTPQVANAQPAEQTPIGQLSTANDAVNTADRSAISGQIDGTENGLNSIKRPLNTEEQKTVTLIRNYIARARDALKVDDLDGASTLSSKAKQLLQELTKP